jgi:hypothetical protein
MLGLLVFWISRSAAAAWACLVTGVLVDLDHLADYVLEFGPRVRLHHFLGAFSEHLFRFVIVPLHGWEWVAAGLAAAWWLDWRPVACSALAAYTLHMTMDQIGNRPRPGAYFLTARILHRFASRFFLGEEEYARRKVNAAKTAGG